MELRRIAMLAGLAFCSCEAQAQAGSGERVLGSFTACRAIAAPDARLDCFDKAASALESAVKARDVTIVDRAEVRSARKSLFGFSIPKLAIFGGGRKDDAGTEEFTEINTTIASARPVANGRIELRLAEGDAVWQTTDPLNFPPKPGTKVRIRKGALGNYFIAIAGERSVRGMRLR